jgi:hypothetical protein
VAFSRLSLALALKPRFVKADGICVWPPLALALYYRLLSINNSIVGKIIKHLMIGLRLRILRQSELLRPPVAQACLLHSRTLTAPHRPPRPTIHPSHASQPRVPATHPRQRRCFFSPELQLFRYSGMAFLFPSSLDD